jgi:hypothetical protein
VSTADDLGCELARATLRETTIGRAAALRHEAPPCEPCDSRLEFYFYDSASPVKVNKTARPAPQRRGAGTKKMKKSR